MSDSRRKNIQPIENPPKKSKFFNFFSKLGCVAAKEEPPVPNAPPKKWENVFDDLSPKSFSFDGQLNIFAGSPSPAPRELASPLQDKPVQPIPSTVLGK